MPYQLYLKSTGKRIGNLTYRNLKYVRSYSKRVYGNNAQIRKVKLKRTKEHIYWI